MNSHLTAPNRLKLSSSILYLIRSRILNKSTTHLDYGCGLGFEFQRLRELGYKSNGYDPYYFQSLPEQADIVTLLHVINVIPSIQERSLVIQKAYALCRKSLVIAARSPQPLKGADYLDGKITRWGTFNKNYSDLELKIFCARSLGIETAKFRRIGQKSIILHRD
jgi:DNA phosphorothioation-associated putative methyltransferase